MDRIALPDPPPKPVEPFDRVYAHVLRFFPELVLELGGDPGILLSQVGLVEGSADSQASVTYRQMVDLLNAASRALNCPDFGMQLASWQGGAAMFGPLGRVMRNSRSFGEALGYVSTHAYAHSLAAEIRLKSLGAGQGVFCGHDILLDRLGDQAQTIEHMLLVGNLAAMELTGGYARARKIHLRHQPVSPPKTYRRYFGCEVLFGQPGDGAIFSEWSLASAIIDADAQAYSTAAAYVTAEFTCHQPPLRARARGVILHLLGTPMCSNAQVAHELMLHPRSLHRHLRSEGTSFHQIKDEVRRDLALYYLQKTDFDFTCISEKLGFAEQAVMTRRCHRWFSTTPTNVRLRANRTSTGG